MAESNSFGYWGVTSEEILKSQFPLHRACRDGDVEALSLLLIEAQHDIYVEDSFYGWTPAHWAAYFGKLACLMRLLQAGLSCDCPTGRLCQTPSHIAAFSCQAHALKWLLHCGASLNRQDYLGETAVHKAARTGSIECASLLASHGARLYICNKNGLNPAQLAANCGYEECSQFLEAAAQRQESEPRGVYETQGPTDPTKVPEPSPHDITAHRVHPCVINQGINGGKLPPSPLTHQSHNGALVSEDCAMEADDGSSCTHNGHTSTAEADSHDVTLDLGVSTNQKPVGGRKRTREDEDECEIKRMRTQVSQATHPSDSFPFATLTLESDDQDGYDYNGVPTGGFPKVIPSGEFLNGGFPRVQDENADPNPVEEALALECEMTTPANFPPKCHGLSGHYI